MTVLLFSKKEEPVIKVYFKKEEGFASILAKIRGGESLIAILVSSVLFHKLANQSLRENLNYLVGSSETVTKSKQTTPAR